MIVLGVESSCDETAAAVVEDGTRILSSAVASQIDVHREYGGVVPELASRKHMEAVVPVVDRALAEAGLTGRDLDAVAATQGPGLVGALLVGFSFAKSFAYASDIPFVGVDHLEAHLDSVFLAPDPPAFPFVSLLASGGHTALYDVRSHVHAVLLGQTRDDAVGEAFDKVAKMLGLGYPGGPIIDRLASGGDPGRISFPRAWLDKDGFDFSFSGLKTAVSRYLETRPDWADETADIAAGFQEAAVEVLSVKLINAARSLGRSCATIVGGAAANSRLRRTVRLMAEEERISVRIPPLSLCGDNAAMVAATGFHRLSAGRTCPRDADVYSRTSRMPQK